MRFGLPETAVARIQAALARHPEVEKAILYGSRAKGDFKLGSDIDLTLFGEALTHRTQLDLMEELDDLLLPWMIDLSIFAELDHPALQAHIQRVGQVFFERHGA
ncbi:MAG: polymerase beta domain protein region [Proteobacteria bacterium]|nr:polymerase beta domain protein region [Pseudomonadota bacterium]